MANDKQKEAAAFIFKKYPDAKELYLTSDGQLFMGGQVGLNNARRHADSIGKGDKAAKPEVIKREDCTEQLKSLEDKAKATAKEKVLAAQDTNYKKMLAPALKALCADRKIEVPEDATKADMIAALEAADKAAV